MNKILFVLFVSFFSIRVIFGQDPEWLKKTKSISLLTSTRADVMKVFGQPENKEPNQLEYFVLKEGRVAVLYTNGKCTKKIEDGIEKIYGWQVPEWSVSEIYIHFKVPVNFKKLKINLSNYRFYKEKDNPTKHYYSRDLGIDYAFVDRKLIAVTYYPPSKYNYLACK